MTTELAPDPTPQLSSTVAECLIPMGSSETASITSAVSQALWESGIEPDDQPAHLAALLTEWVVGLP